MGGALILRSILDLIGTLVSLVVVGMFVVASAIARRRRAS